MMTETVNVMRKIRVGKITLNVGAGKSQPVLEKGIKLIELVTGVTPVKTRTKKRIAAWGLRPGLPIGCKVTLRGEEAEALLKRLLAAKDNRLISTQFNDGGTISFGIHEYIDIPEVNYDPDIGIMGFQVCVTLERPGFRVKKRRNKKARIGKKHRISKEDSIEFLEKNYKTKVDDE